jgi:hypothetical protein
VPAELQENGPNDPTTLCIVHSGVNSKLIKYFIYFRLHPWRVRGFENPLRPIHRSLCTLSHRPGNRYLDASLCVLRQCITVCMWPLRGEEIICSLVLDQRSVSWDSLRVVGQISRTSFICPPIPATSHTPTLAASGGTINE